MEPIMPASQTKINEYLADYESDYVLTSKNTFHRGEDQRPISLETVSNIHLTQEVSKKNIITTITVKETGGSTSDNSMKPHLQQALALADIAKTISVKRNLKGEVLSVVNTEQLKNDWHNWQEHKMPGVIPGEREQQRFVAAYEKGMKKLAENFSNSFQYMLLLPSFLNFHEFKVPGEETGHYILHSKLFENIIYQYRFFTDTIINEEDVIQIRLMARLEDEVKLKEQINGVHKYIDNFSLKDFKFSMVLRYVFYKADGSIAAAKLDYAEQLHEHYKYQVALSIE